MTSNQLFIFISPS